MLVAGLLKELKIANAGILGATQVKSGYVRTFHELLTHHVFSCLFVNRVLGPDRLAPSRRQLTLAIVLAEVNIVNIM